MDSSGATYVLKPATTRMKILIAEDELISSEILVNTLEDFGHEVTACINGEEAWSTYLAEPHRIIVSDWFMPKIDGLEFCRRVRSHPDLNYTYFILLTGNVQGDAYRQAMDAGVDDFLTKPLDHHQIWVRLRVAQRILLHTQEISRLEDMLPICSYCKKVRKEKGYWQQVERYIAERTGTAISHGVCPDCFEKVVLPQIEQVETLKH